MVAVGLLLLHVTDPTLVTQPNRDALIASGENVQEVVDGLGRLHAADPTLLTQDNFDLLFDFDQDTKEREPILLTRKNFDLLFGRDHPTDEQGRAILYIDKDSKVLLPDRRLPAQLTQASFEEFTTLFMAAKYNPSSQAVKNAQESFYENDRKE